MRAATVIALAAIALAAAGCAGGESNWTKAGATSDAASSDYDSCRDEARAATKRDAAIDADIMATRGTDWQRTGTLTANQDMNAHYTRSNSQAIIASCMRAKGYQPAG